MSGYEAAELRRQLKHPVVDCDGHWLETPAVLGEYLKDVAGPEMVDRYFQGRDRGRTRIPGYASNWYEATDEQLIKQRLRRGVWWPYPYKASEHATFRLPRLFYERLDEMGIDFAIVYPTAGLMHEGIRDADMRAAVIRAHNIMTMDLYGPYADRMTPVAVVPRRTPQEAIAEATYAVKELGYKAVMINGTVHRRSVTDERYVDALGLDNEEDYDPLWQACVDLKVAVTSHAGSLTWSDRASVTNYVFNHVGHFAQANHVFCKAVFLGGVSNRFPTLNFGFLEGGVGWARNLYHDLIGHFEKRTYENASTFLDPREWDAAAFGELYDRYAEGRMKGLKERVIHSIDQSNERGTLLHQYERETRHIHDFGPAGCSSKEEVAEKFSRNFYFGCEADDPMTALAFDPRMGKPLHAVFSSDISHWDVPEVTDVLPEAFELVEHGMLNEDDFRRFVFGNAVRLHGKMNPDFFKGTRIEKEAAAELNSEVRI